MNDRALILVADDDPDDQYFLQEAIAVVCPEEVETHFLWDGAQLLRFLREKAQQGYRRNLVVLDLNMKVKDGKTTLRELKADPAFANIPVVILSTSSDERDIEYCRRNGAAAYFRKPSSILGLIEIMRTLRTEYLN